MPADRFVAIACGGTGGHLFPGMAVGEKLLERGCDVALLVSKKEIDQLGVKTASGMEVLSLPAIPLLRGNFAPFLLASWQSLHLTRRYFRTRRPAAVLAMGGFTSAGPIIAGNFSWASQSYWNLSPRSRARGVTSVERMLRQGRATLRACIKHPAVIGYAWDAWQDEPGEQPPFAGGLVHLNDVEAREHTELLSAVNSRVSGLRAFVP